MMDNQEAIKWLREAEILDLASGNTKDREAVNMAISALQAQEQDERNCSTCKHKEAGIAFWTKETGDAICQDCIDGVYQKWEPQKLANNSPKLDSKNDELATDCISRQAAIDALMEKDKKLRNINWYDNPYAEGECGGIDEALSIISNLPSAQPTLCGYDFEHLILIANMLRKENLPPERVVEALTDIGRIVSIVTNEFEESLRKAVEQCKI